MMGENFQAGDEVCDFGVFVFGIFEWCAVCTFEEFEPGNGQYKTVTWAACSKGFTDHFM